MRKPLPPPKMPEDEPGYRQLQSKHQEVMNAVGPNRYAFASAHLFAKTAAPKRRRYAVM